MSKEWDYAKMSHEASLAGGPEKWIEIIKEIHIMLVLRI